MDNHKKFKDEVADSRGLNNAQERERTKAMRKHRGCEFLKQLFHYRNPKKIIPAMLWVLVLIAIIFLAHSYGFHSIVNIPSLYTSIVWVCEKIAKTQVPDYISTSSLQTAFATLTYVFVVLFFIPVTCSGVCPWLGKPPRANKIDRDIAAAFGIKNAKAKNYFERPFIISYHSIMGSEVIEYAFWSGWIPVEEFNKPEVKAKILHALKSHTQEDFKSGGKDGNDHNIIIIRVSPGVNPIERGGLTDDEI